MDFKSIENEVIDRGIDASVKGAFLVADQAGSVVWSNKQAADLVGFSCKELLGKTVMELLVDSSWQSTHDLQAIFRSRDENKFSVRKTLRTKDDTALNALLDIQLYKFSNDQHYSVIVVSDFTREDTSRKSLEYQYKQIVEHADDIMFTVNVSGDFLCVNSKAIELTKYTEEELLKLNYVDLVEKSERSRVLSYFSAHFSSKEDVAEFVFPIESKTKEVIWVDQKLKTIWDEDKKVIIGYSAIARYITQERERDRDVQENKQKFDAIYSHIPVPVMLIDQSTNLIIDANPFMIDSFKYSLGELKCKSLSDLIAADDSEKLQQYLSRGLGHDHVQQDVRFFGKNGKQFDLQIRLNRIKISDRDVILLVCTDVTELKSLGKENTRFKAALSNSPYSIFILNLQDDQFVDVNATACAHFGYTKEEILNIKSSDVFLDDIAKSFDKDELLHRLLVNKQNEYQVESSCVRKDGSLFPTRILAKRELIEEEDFIIISVLGIEKEQRDEKRLFEQNQKLRIIRTLQNDFISAKTSEDAFVSFLDSIVLYTKSTCGFMGAIDYNAGQASFNLISKADNSKNGILDDFFDDFFTKKGGMRNENNFFTEVVKYGEYLITNDLKVDKRKGDLPPSSNVINSCIGIPVKASGEVIGMIMLGNKEGGYVYNDIITLQSFVSAYSVMLKSVQEKKEKLQTEVALLEKETLLKEIHHRVKNNMQVISSLLTLTFSKYGDDVRQSLEDSTGRINTMALVHEQLYDTSNLKELNSSNYIRGLVSYLESIYKNRQSVDVQLVIDEVIVDLDKAVPLGLIINEVLSNSFKYAFQNVEHPQIHIVLRKESEKVIVELSDNGNVVKDKSELVKKSSLGNKLIANLCRQLKATMEVSVENGVSYKIIF